MTRCGRTKLQRNSTSTRTTRLIILLLLAPLKPSSFERTGVRYVLKASSKGPRLTAAALCCDSARMIERISIDVRFLANPWGRSALFYEMKMIMVVIVETALSFDADVECFDPWEGLLWISKLNSEYSYECERAETRCHTFGIIRRASSSIFVRRSNALLPPQLGSSSRRLFIFSIFFSRLTLVNLENGVRVKNAALLKHFWILKLVDLSDWKHSSLRSEQSRVPVAFRHRKTSWDVFSKVKVSVRLG